MDKFHLLVARQGADPITEKFLAKACQKRKIEMVIVSADSYDFSKLYRIKNTDGMYRLSDTPRTIKLAKILLDSKCVTFHSQLTSLQEFNDAEKSLEATILHQKKKLPIIKTIFDITTDRRLLRNYANYLGGFPLIMKALGGYGGTGVMKIDSFESLVSICDHLCQRHQDTSYILRQFVEHVEQAKITVLGSQVIDSISYKRSREDFRSNVGRKRVASVNKFSSAIEQVAIEAVNVLSLEFGGVDILVSQDGGFHLAEVNFPYPFVASQLVTGTDIAGQMIDYLNAKSKQKQVSFLAPALQPAKGMKSVTGGAGTFLIPAGPKLRSTGGKPRSTIKK